MRVAHALTLIAREARSSRARLLFFTCCLALGVAAVVAVAGLSNALEQTIRSRAREILAADLSVSARRSLPEDLGERFAAHGIEITRVREMATLVSSSTGRSQLVELKVVDGEYPFYGSLVLDPPGRLAQRLTAENCAVAPDLLARLGLRLGDSLRIGSATFTIDTRIEAEPDRVNFSLTLGPRVFVSAAGFARADLEKQGSSIRHVALGRDPGDGRAARQLVRELKAMEAEAPYLRTQTYDQAQPALRDGIRRTRRFLALVALASLLVGGIGVAQTVRAWIAGRLDAIAIQKCLGMSSREILGLYAAQTALLAAVGSTLGALVGLLAQRAVVAMFRDYVPAAGLDVFQPAALARGVGLGMAVAMLFSLRPLLQTLSVPPSRVLRRSAEPLGGARWVSPALTVAWVAGMVLAALWQSESWTFALAFTAAVLAVAGALYGAARGLVALCGRPWRERLPLSLRHGVAALARPGSGTLGAIVSLGLGVLVVLTIQLVQSGLARELDGDLSRKAPTVFLVDVQTAQWPQVDALLQRRGAQDVQSAPVIAARISAIDGESIESLLSKSRDERGSRWTLTREQRLTYRESLPDDNELVAGRWWDDPTRAEVSVDADFAEGLGVGIGSRLSFDVQGVEVELTVTSLRRIQWRTFNLNFFLLAEPGALDDAPQFRVVTARVAPADELPLQDELSQACPNVTMLRLREILEKLTSVLEKVGSGVRLLGLCTVLSGAMILLGAIGAGAARRGREVALFKTLGLSRADVARIYATEHGLTGLVSGLIGAAGAQLLAYGVLVHGMGLDFRFELRAHAVAIASTTLLAMVAGLAASARALLVRPAEALRAD